MFTDARQLLSETAVDVHPAEFGMISVEKEDWPSVLADQSLGPDGKTPFLIFSNDAEVTLVLTRPEVERFRSGKHRSKVELGFRLLTFTKSLEFNVVGYMAEISRILADAEVPIIALSSFSRDHLLIKQTDLPTALLALGPHVSDLC